MFRRFILPIMAFCGLGAVAQSAILQPVPGPTHPYRFTISPSASITVVEASTDLRTWVGIHTNAASASATVVTDAQSANFPRRFYRVVTLGTALPDLASLPNT